MKSLCRALLVLNILYCILALTQEGLPGWRMFESAERIDYSLRDRDGVAIDVRSVLPKDAWLVDHIELDAIVRFVCENDRSRAPYSYEDRPRGFRAVVGPLDCAVHRR